MVDKTDSAPLPPEELAPLLAEIYEVVGPLYRRAHRLVERDAPIDGLSVGVRAVLERLAETGPETVPQMGRAMALSRQFVQRMVNDAGEQDYVELRPNPAHQRSRLVAITDEGRIAMSRLKAREHAALGQVGGDLTGDDIGATLRVLRHMLAAMDDVSVD